MIVIFIIFIIIMNLIRKYKIKYNLIGGMNLDLLPEYIKEIKKNFINIKSLYSHGDLIIITELSAILYYLYIYNFTDLIEEIKAPTNIIYLLISPEPNTQILVPFIGDFKRISVSKKDTKYENIKNIATFENNWIFNLKIKSFDLVIPIQSIIFNNFNDINLIDLNQLKIHYINNKNNSLIQLIDKIIDRINILEADK
jgi:hypothetical protein